VEFLLVLAILLAVVYVVTGPLRRPEAAGQSSSSTDRDGVDPDGVGARAGAAAAASDPGGSERESELSELGAAREAKYREIRDTQLDYDTGKLSREDFEALDTGLRREALEILQQIDRLQPPAPGPAPFDSPEPGLHEPD
jgi:hypothetical protein